MKGKQFYMFMVLVLLAILVACAPKEAPTAAPMTPSVLASRPVPAPQAPAAPENTAWANVVESARKEGRLIIYGTSNFAGDRGPAVAQAFRERYGIVVEILSMPGRQIVEKVKVEQQLKQPIADIAASGVSTHTELSISRMVATVWQKLPELKDKKVFKVDPVYTPAGDVLFMNINQLGTLINTKLVKSQDEPRSYLDFLEPRWKGKIIMEDPRGGAGGEFNWFTTMRYLKVLDDDYFLRFLKQEPLFFPGGSQEVNRMVGRGEYWLKPIGSPNSSGPTIQAGAPLKLLGMKEGSIVQGEGISVVNGTSHPNAALVFMNWIFSPEGQSVYAKAGGIAGIRHDLPDFTDPRARLQPEPQRLLVRSFEVAEAGNQYLKEGIVEAIFGKK